jgi:hypothetical protein
VPLIPPKGEPYNETIDFRYYDSVLLIASCSSWGTPFLPNITSTGEISGIAIDSNDGSPIPFANVITNPSTSSVTTDNDGRYSIPGVHPGTYTVIASKQDKISREVRVSVVAGDTTTADLHFGIIQSAYTATDDHTPGQLSFNMLSNGNLDENDYGIIENWAQTNIDLYRWYLVQDVPPSEENGNARWIEWVELFGGERGHELRSFDFQNCSYFCSTSAVQIVPAEENKVYSLSAEAMREWGKGGTLYIDFLNASKARIEAHSKGGYSSEWRQQEITVVAPAGTKYIRVVLYTNNGAQGIVSWDNVELRAID